MRALFCTGGDVHEGEGTAVCDQTQSELASTTAAPSHKLAETLALSAETGATKSKRRRAIDFLADAKFSNRGVLRSAHWNHVHECHARRGLNRKVRLNTPTPATR
jgi:hypothetical protein